MNSALLPLVHVASVDLEDDIVGADMAMDTGKHRDSAHSNAEHDEDSLDEQGEHTAGSIRMGPQADGRHNPYNLYISGNAKRGNEVDS